MYHQLMGIEMCLLSVLGDTEGKKLLKLLEDGKKTIGEKHVKFFEKEEGHLYEKIGEGIYQRNAMINLEKNGNNCV